MKVLIMDSGRLHALASLMGVKRVGVTWMGVTRMGVTRGGRAGFSLARTRAEQGVALVGQGDPSRGNG